MDGGIQNSLDALASNNILNFDADAYVGNTAPRYVGTLPQNYLPFDRPLGNYPTAPMLLPRGIRIQQQVSQDGVYLNNGIATASSGIRTNQNSSFVRTTEKNKIPAWKKIMLGVVAGFGILALACGIAGLKGAKGSVSNAVNKSGFLTKIKEGCSKAWTSVKTACSNGWTKFKGIFKK